MQQQIYVITGHYGCGKTSFAVSLAEKLRDIGEQVTLVDLDIVNPYFRSADFKNRAEAKGIRVVAPVYAGTNLDLPSLSAAVDAAIQDGGQVILDVGGDDAGAIALGRYAGLISKRPYSFYYLFNQHRLLTSSPADCVQSLRNIEAASRLQATGLVSNPNLGRETTAELVRESLPFAEEVARLSGLPLLGTAAAPTLLKELSGLRELIPLTALVRLPWENPIY